MHVVCTKCTKVLSSYGADLWASDIIGGIIFAGGLAIEATADQQKFNFKMNPSNKGRFVNTGNSRRACCSCKEDKQRYEGSFNALELQACGAWHGTQTTLGSSASGCGSCPCGGPLLLLFPLSVFDQSI